MTPLEYEIRTKADLGALERTKKALTDVAAEQRRMGQDSSATEAQILKVDSALNSNTAGYVRQAAALKEVIANTKQLNGDTKAHEDQLKALTAKIGGGGGVFSGIKEKGEAGLKAYDAAGGGISGGIAVFKALGPVALGAAAGIKAVELAYEGLKKSKEAFEEKQDSVTALDASLKQRGQLTDEYREKLQQLADTQEELTNIKGDEWIKALTTLTKFGADASNIDAAADAVKNLAGFLGGDLQQASFMIGKALVGNTAMLGRFGIEVDENGTRAQKLEQIYQQLAQRGAGQLEAATLTLTGQKRALGLAVGRLFEGMGNLLARTGLLGRSSAALVSVMNALARVFPAVVGQVKGLDTSLVNVSTTLHNTEDDNRDYAASLAQIATDAASARQELEGLNAASAKRESATIKEAEHTAKLAQIQLEKDRKTGLPEGEYAKRKQAIEEKLITDRAAAQSKGANTEIENAQGSQEKAIEELRTLQERKKSADEALDREKQAVKLISTVQSLAQAKAEEKAFREDSAHAHYGGDFSQSKEYNDLVRFINAASARAREAQEVLESKFGYNVKPGKDGKFSFESDVSGAQKASAEADKALTSGSVEYSKLAREASQKWQAAADKLLDTAKSAAYALEESRAKYGGKGGEISEASAKDTRRDYESMLRKQEEVLKGELARTQATKRRIEIEDDLTRVEQRKVDARGLDPARTKGDLAADAAERKRLGDERAAAREAERKAEDVNTRKAAQERNPTLPTVPIKSFEDAPRNLPPSASLQPSIEQIKIFVQQIRSSDSGSVQELAAAFGALANDAAQQRADLAQIRQLVEDNLG